MEFLAGLAVGMIVGAVGLVVVALVFGRDKDGKTD